MTPPLRIGLRRRLLLTFLIVLSLGLLLFTGTIASAAPNPQTTETPSATVTPTFDLSRLDEPVTADPPGQIDRGAVHYWGVCMACHGDYGQGLIPAWQDAFGEDKDCWQSNCHGPDHPPEGFRMYKDNLAPAIAGPGKLARFSNAFELYDYIYETMPWWNPGSITREEAWSLANYVLKLNGTRPDGLTLTTTNGYAIPVHRAVTLPEAEWPGALALAGALILAAIGLVLQAAPRHTDTTAIALSKPNFVHHLHPPSIPALQSRFRYTLGAGGISVFLCLILLVTGLLEMYFYVPSPEGAATSIQVITTLVPFGNLARNLHYWSAQLLLVVITVHLLRVVLTGAYAKPRRFNFLLGLGLLVIILLLDFTGYILRWDEGIRWALVVGTNLLKTIPWIGDGFYQFMMGGPEAGPATLTRFYTWHIFGLTIGATILIGWHAFRVRRDGGIAVPPPPKRRDNSRITRFELLRREVLAMVIVGTVLLLIAVLIPAPIDQPISGASIDITDSRAPWFFLWVQQLLKYGDPFLWGVLTPLLVILGMGLVPYVLPGAKVEELGRWLPRGNRIAQITIVLIVMGVIALTILASFPTTY